MKKLLSVCFVVLLTGCGERESVEAVKTGTTVRSPVQPVALQPQSEVDAKLEKLRAIVGLNDNGTVRSLYFVEPRHITAGSGRCGFPWPAARLPSESAPRLAEQYGFTLVSKPALE